MTIQAKSGGQSSVSKLALALGVPEALLPLLPELLADIWQLGSWPAHIVDTLRSVGIKADSKVLELGSGKGAVAVHIAGELRCRVTGIDLFEPFLHEAREQAAVYGVAHLCTFHHADIEAVLSKASEQYDVVVLAGVGSFGGSLRETVVCLRSLVPTGGYIVIDDGFLAAGSMTSFSGYQYYRSQADTHRELTALGDKLLREIVISTSDLKAYNDANNRSIRGRASALISRFPHMRKFIEQFIADELEECRFLEHHTIPAVWLLQKV